MDKTSPEKHQRVMSILADVMECDTGERENLLAQWCGHDESLRQEVECLLRDETPAQGFMEEPLLNVAMGLQTEEEESLLGTHIGPYLIIDEIGRGGMGDVYLARRSDDEYQRRVAIKLIKRGMDSNLIQRRFRNERQILANLDHQHIARLYDGGTTEDGRAFLVMEYVSGEAIDVYADTQKLSTTERLKLFLAVCDAVQYAHRQQVIHRDLKPSNILVNKEGVPKLLDFGIAKFLDGEAAADATTLAWRLLTPEYASPEQIRGEQSTVASDVYSLGAVLYELLTGHRPHPLTKRRGSDGMAHPIVTREPERPSSIVSRIEGRATRSRAQPRTITPESVSESRDGAPERLRRSLRGDLDNIVLMALRKDPQRRYASVEDFSNDLRRHLARQPVLARKDSLGYRGRRFFERNRTSVISAAVVAVVCLLIGVSLNFFTRHTKPPITSIGVLPFVNVGQDQQVEYLADGLTISLIDYLSRLPHLNVPGHNSVRRYKGQALDSIAAGRALKVDTLMLGRATTNGETLSVSVEVIDAPTNQIIWNKRFDGRVSEVLLLQQQIAEEVTRSLGLTISAEARAQFHRPNTRNAEAYRLYLRGDYFWNLRTELGLARATDLFRGAIDQDPNYALAYSGLANSYGLLGAYRSLKPDEVFPKARNAALRARELDADLAEAYTSLAFVSWLYEWDWAAADQAFRRAIELKPSYVLAHHWYGLYLAEMGRFEEAIASEKRALERDPLSVYVNADLGRVYYYARRYDDAFAQYRKTIEMNPNFGGFYSELGELYEQTDMFDEYISAVNPVVAHAEAGRQLFAQRGRKGYWEEIWRQISNRSPHRWTEYYELARVAARLGKKDKAFENLNRAYDVRDHFMTQLKVDPILDPLRSDPRYHELLRRMNLAN
jgi:serine/threonine protein kinase/tetratricopeptide (TPR) repeat protein